MRPCPSLAGAEVRLGLDRRSGRSIGQIEKGALMGEAAAVGPLPWPVWAARGCQVGWCIRFQET
jgi:hypothetical protein